MLPRVILHNAASADGRIDWFTPDLGQFYGLAGRWNEDATLAGCDTLLDAPEEIPEEGEGALAPRQPDSADTRPLLVVPDSRGRLRSWHWWREQPYWREGVALCSHTTPQSYLDYLKARHIDSIIAGDDHVDFRAALETLSDRYGVQTVRVDSGGTLNGVLLRAGLVDEVSLLVHPHFVGGLTLRSIFRAPDLTAPGGVVQLKLAHVERLDGDVVWLRYEVVKS
jgi:2,5-diamino-6-(ribosylamino)-4(3H)-pyrimidinone 5'-phosphate reductase